MRLTPECCSVHTHSVLCDGKGTLAEMAAAAYAAGVRFFGASGHSHTEIPHDAGNVLPTDPAEYRKQVLRLRTEYAGRMEVLLGIEQDSRSAQPVPDWADYSLPTWPAWEPCSRRCRRSANSRRACRKSAS